jgi:hypothetical protein
MDLAANPLNQVILIIWHLLPSWWCRFPPFPCCGLGCSTRYFFGLPPQGLMLAFSKSMPIASELVVQVNFFQLMSWGELPLLSYFIGPF